MKPLALNLYCGIYEDGWANGLTKAGWFVVNVGIEIEGQLPGASILADVREIAKDPEKYFPALKFDLIVASPPCQEFSYSALPFKKARNKFSKENPPDPSLWRAAEEIARKLGVPLILENVQGARKWMGKNSWKYGSYYFWGEMPALIPIGCPRKGFGRVKEAVNPSDPWDGFGGSSYQSRGKKGPLNQKRIPGFEEKHRLATPSERVNATRGPEMSAQRDAYKPMVGSVKYKRIHGAEQAGTHGGNLRKRWSAKVAMIPEELSQWIGQCFYPDELKEKRA